MDAPVRPKVLIIDDDELVGRAVTRILSAQYEVTCHSHPRRALDDIRAGARFDAIVCDMMMPELTGVDVFDALDGDLREQRERMIFITGGALSEDAQRFLDARSDSFLPKPISRVALEAAVRAVVARAQP